MDADKLAKIRAIAEEGDILYKDQETSNAIVQAAGKNFGTLPYTRECTFLGRPRTSSLEGADIALVGIPYDGALSGRPGTRYGPRAVREQSVDFMGPLNHATGLIPASLCNIIDYGDVNLRSVFTPEKVVAEIESFYTEIVDAQVTPITVGGDHSVTYPILRALARDEPIALIHLDAHCDTGSPFGGTRFTHAGPFRNAAIDGLIDPERTIQIGIRGPHEVWWDFSYRTGMRVMHAEEFREIGVAAAIKEARRVVGDVPTYITFDVDALDPVYAPGTGTPEAGGLTTAEAQQFIRGLQGLNLVGGDVVEVSPPYDSSDLTAIAGANMLWEITCVVADAVASRRK